MSPPVMARASRSGKASGVHANAGTPSSARTAALSLSHTGAPSSESASSATTWTPELAMDAMRASVCSHRSWRELVAFLHGRETVSRYLRASRPALWIRDVEDSLVHGGVPCGSADLAVGDDDGAAACLGADEFAGQVVLGEAEQLGGSVNQARARRYWSSSS